MTISSIPTCNMQAIGNLEAVLDKSVFYSLGLRRLPTALVQDLNSKKTSTQMQVCVQTMKIVP